MSEASPLVKAQQDFVKALAVTAVGSERCALSAALGRILHDDVLAPIDMPPFPRAIVEGFLVHTADTAAAKEDSPVSLRIAGEVRPGDEHCPDFARGDALRVATGSIVPAGDYSIVRMWEAKQADDRVSFTRAFAPRFFIEEQGCDLRREAVAVAAGTVLDPEAIGMVAGLGLNEVMVARRPMVTVFSSGDELVPHTAPIRPGVIRDSNSVMLTAAVAQAGGIASFGGIMADDFDAFITAARRALEQSDMLLISGGTAIGGRDFISDLVGTLGELIVDGVPMRSGRPLIMGVAQGKPIVCVAGHPPEALRGFRLFGVAALDRLLGRDAALPQDV